MKGFHWALVGIANRVASGVRSDQDPEWERLQKTVVYQYEQRTGKTCQTYRFSAKKCRNQEMKLYAGTLRPVKRKDTFAVLAC